MAQKTTPIYYLFLLLSILLIYIWSLIKPTDLYTWFLEMLPVILGAGVLLLTFRRFRFTSLTYTLIWGHAVILLVGAHYTYAEVPLFDRLKEVFDLSRNHYDRVGHFAQGFVPAMIARELLIRCSPLRGSRWLWPLVVAVCLAVSALYELAEWIIAAMTGSAADAFLGTQGDVWDTQKDMAFCLAGAVAALLSLATWQNREIKRLEASD